ncbi:MAG: hypothetical protein O7D91_04390, partial [Planctomycetota bacterium]|nr:hypothetical protein [Planctomycetota bacterium]
MAGVLMGTSGSLAKAQENGYFGISPGYDFPADNATLERYRETQNIAALRLHAWNVFAGMTQPTPDGEARWETWFRTGETFRIGPVPQALVARRIVREFGEPRQFTGPPGMPVPEAVGASLLSAVLFNKEAHDFIRDNDLFLKSKLTEINQSFPADTPWNERKIPDFPREAVVLKTVWWPVAKDTPTPMPIWDFEPTRANSAGNDYPTWKRVVAVDPTRDQVPPNETMAINFGAKEHPNAHVVTLNDFYHFELDGQTAQAANQSSAREAALAALGRQLQAGDFVVFAQ